MNPEQLQEARRVARLIIGFIQHNLTQAEREHLDQWICANDQNMELFQKLTDEERVEESMQWFRNIDQQAALQKIEEKISAEKKYIIQVRSRPVWYAIAASVLIVAGVFVYRYAVKAPLPEELPQTLHQEHLFARDSAKPILVLANGNKIDLTATGNSKIDIGESQFVQNENNSLRYVQTAPAGNNTLLIPAGKQYQVVLSDGTKIWLNSMSSLYYPSFFSGDSRIVRLEGEGYFEVMSNSTKPFFVKSGNILVKVTGTHFNVHAYRNDKQQVITLLEGGITLTVNNTIKILKPEQEARVVNEKLTVSNNIYASESVSWTTGVFSFRKASMQEVMNQLSRWYGILPEYDGIVTKEFTGSIPRNSSLREVLQMLELSSGVHFSVTGKKITVHP